MRTFSFTAPQAPHLVESAELLQARPKDRPAAGALAMLSRSLSLVALGGCVALALATMHASGRRLPPVGPQPVAEVARPSSPATPEQAPVKDVRLVYGNPDELRSASPTTDAAIAEPPRAVAAVVPISTPSPTAPAVVTAPAPEEAALPALTPPPAAGSGAVDLNTASIDQLNGLDAGMIGRAIARGRPYASPRELVERRILNRATFEKIKDRVAVNPPSG